MPIKMKYVLNVNTKNFLIFPITMNHNRIDGEWTNAGFIGFFPSRELETSEKSVDVICFGESVSLELKSGDDDMEIIRNGMRSY